MKKMIMFLLAFLSLNCLASCYKQETFEFQDGRYQYVEEDFYIYEDILVTDLYISLINTNDENINKNLLINRKNNKKYAVDFVITIDNDMSYKCNFTMRGNNGKVGEQIDRYYGELDISEIINKKNSILILFLEFDTPYDYKNNIQRTEATQIYIQTKYIKFGDGSQENTLCPSRLKLELTL